MEGSLLKRGKLLSRENLIYLLFISTYLHYVITGAVMLVAVVAIVTDKVARKQLFVHPGSKFLPVFSAAAFLMAAVVENWLGALCAAGFFLILLIMLWVRSVMRRGVFERALSYCAAVSCIMAPLAVLELKFFPPADMRIKLWFFNSNYMAFMSLIAFAICVYKLLHGKGHLWTYAVGIVCNLVTMYICGSIFIWVDVFVVTALLLVLFKKWPSVAILFGILAAVFIALEFMPELLPRYSVAGVATDQRFSIWRAAIQEIKKSPFIGKGFLGFNHIHGEYPDAYPAPHTHNILLEVLLDFGLVGTALMLPFFVCYIRNLKKCYEYYLDRRSTNLILALLVAMAIHGFTDIVFLWIQTGGLMALIMGGLGMDEKLLGRIIAMPPSEPATSQQPEQKA